MTRADLLQQLLATKIIAIIRLSNSEPVFELAQALFRGGVKAIEVTMGTPNALEEIHKLSQIEGVIPGVGSVIDPQTAKAAIEAGAQFIVTPVSKPEVIQMAHQLDKPILSGAMTPTEILQAYEWGADIVKLFPAANLGATYFKAVKAPIPHVPIMPTGGITVENAADWIANGAVCLGVGSTLVNQNLITQRDYKSITSVAKAMTEAVKK
ncbi:MAG: bifunctional 4-hydroxy-2-oxoglutarate aldolase/2-dehydro-3-deoxy-phosphogluconate aldolase [Flavobacteriia bacterium]|jgi:2-dehydro-3-deoxyphosphogluconate aldolase/(4S)-4-hydroxy-2-oxoglutarate aldolase|nr:bifunctional 4-hydroxy-2-oxoglutarate aldolase/2-dehydro-3-deoxy-phosphogluconate aldolase [Flavobacteriia bacterium]